MRKDYEIILKLIPEKLLCLLDFSSLIHIVNNNNPKNPDIIARSTNLLTSFTLSTFKIIGRRSDENNPKRTKNSRDALSLVLL